MNAYNPYGYGYPNMQGRLEPYNPYVQPYQNVANAPRKEQLLGYIVNTMEDAKTAKIDFDGSTSYFPCPSENAIYAKSMDLDGRVVMKVYKLQNVPQVQYADSNAVQMLQARLDKMEKVLREELGYKDEPVTTNTNVTK